MTKSKTARDGGRAALGSLELRDHARGSMETPSARTFLPLQVQRLLWQARSSW